MKHFRKQNSSISMLHGTIGIQMNNIVYTSKQKQYQFSSKNPSATKNSPLSNVYYMEFFLNFLFEYSFICIVKLKFTRINEMWCRILRIEDLSKKVRKTQDRTSLRGHGCRARANICGRRQVWRHNFSVIVSLK